jgi:Zn-dependent membrane protease YugP
MGTTLFYVIAGAVFLFSMVVRFKLKTTYQKWGQVRSATGKPGGQVAAIILAYNQLDIVRVEPVEGVLSDHYDPLKKRIGLSKDNFFGNSVAATAVAAHECGHAIQDATGYGPLKLRSAALPIASIGARFGLPVAIFGWVFGSSLLVQLGVLGYAASILLTFLVLPVEFNASKRALEQLKTLNLVSNDGYAAAEEILKVAAMTYVAGVAQSAGYLIFLVISGVRTVLGSPKPPPGILL